MSAGGGQQQQSGPQGPAGADVDPWAVIYGNEVQPFAGAGVPTIHVVNPPAAETFWFGDAQVTPTGSFNAAAFTMTRAGRLTSFWSAMEGIVVIPANPNTPDASMSIGVWKAEPGDAPLLIASRPLPTSGAALPMATVVPEGNLDALLMPGDRVSMGITMTPSAELPPSGFVWSSVSGSVLV